MRVGPYKLLQFLGEGGMGTVFLAEQSRPIRRMVALKIIKHGMDSTHVLARFEAERQALALMDHPNIAKVLDAGSISEAASEAPDGAEIPAPAAGPGRPYFVMELVKGVPITDFCDKNKLTMRQRLELFIPVCQALQHAHMKGIIHRDIKPSNVLVALYDGKPVPKVIDFGVAKAMAEPLTHRTLFTQIGQIVGTFEYMSPEQATLNQLDIDTRSDIYSLGVLLYELLTSVTPFDKDRLRQLALDQMLRTIREEEPMRPSVRLSSQAGALVTAAAYRGVEPPKLAGLLRGDLDWIVMKCLEKERDRRFVTAGSLAQDVERYLRDEPVTACPPSLSYGARKAYRKNKAAVFVAATIVVLLLAGVIGSTGQAIRATKAERAAARDRDAAVAASQEATDERDKTQAALTRLELSQKEMRANQYAWDIQSLQHVWEAGNVAEARGMLARQLPDLRGFEWHYWDRQTSPERSSGALQFPPELGSPKVGPSFGFRSFRADEWFFNADGRRVAHCGIMGQGNQGSKIALMVWDVATRKLLRSWVIPPEQIDGEDSDFVLDSGTSMSRDGKRVLLAGSYTRRRAPDPETGMMGPGFPRTSRHLILAWDVDSDRVLFDLRKVPNIERLRFFSVSRLSPDGRRFVTALGVDQRDPADRPADQPAFAGTKVWDLDAADREPVTIDGNIGNAGFVTFSPDGSRLVGGLSDNKRTPLLWDAATGKELHRWDFQANLVFSPGDGKLLAGAVLEGDNETKLTRVLKVFDARTGKQVSSYALPGDFSRQLNASLGQQIGGSPNPVFSPDGSLVVVPHSVPTDTVGGRRRVSLYFVKSDIGEILHTLEDPISGRIRRVDQNVYGRDPRFFSGDGKQLICRVDNEFRTFDVRTGQEVNTLRGHVNEIMAAVPTADGRYLFSLESDGMLKEWDLSPREPVRIATGERSPSLTVSADGAWVAWVHKTDDEQTATVQVCDTGGKQKPITLQPRPRNASGPDASVGPLLLSADGKRVARIRVNARRPGQTNVEPFIPLQDVTVWDVASGKELFHADLGRPDDVGSFNQPALSPDGATLVIIQHPRDDAKNRRSTIRVFDIQSRSERPAIAVDGRAIGPRFSPDGKRILSMVHVYNPDGGIAVHAAVWDLDRGVQVFSVDVGDKNAYVRSGGPYPWEVAGNVTPLWTPDGTRLALVEAANPQCRFLDAANGKLVKTVTLSPRAGTVGFRNRAGQFGAPFGQNFTIAFSPDGRRIAFQSTMRTGALTVSILDADSGKELLSLPTRSTGRPYDQSLAFSSDGHLLRRFDSDMLQSGAPDPDTGRPLLTTRVVVTTWDATPLPEPKQP
jgi:serine/threonine protein kinase/WD40 repeat protein